jgi:AcrR family transcriptional regulator
MRTHGWGGKPPRDDAEAVARIRAATHECVAEFGAGASISHVAERLAVTRQTVYRYFPSSTELLMSAALDGTQGYLAALGERLQEITDPQAAVVEAVAFTIEAVPDEPYLRLLLGSGGRTALIQTVTSKYAREVGRALLERAGVDWAQLGYTGVHLDELSEWILRVLQSFLVDAGDPERTPAELRAYLYRWLAPVISVDAKAQAPRRTA